MVSMVSDSFEESSELRLDEGGRCPSRSGHRLGLFTGDSEGAKRPTFRTPGSDRSGKIDLRGAEAQAMHQTMTKEGSGKEEKEEQTDIGFDLTLRSHGHIRVETLSWIAIIRRTHGFGDSSDQGLPPLGVGRTASANSRVSDWIGSGSGSEAEAEASKPGDR